MTSTPSVLPRTTLDARRKADARLEVSRVAADLIWREGLSEIRGEDIAAAAGISPRTLWRYFPSKEDCVGPILESLADPFVALLAAWPSGASFADFVFADERSGTVEYTDDQVRGMRMVVLGESEPALRSAWLTVCDGAERRARPLIAARLGLEPDDGIVHEVAAAVGGASRALNDHLAAEHIRTGGLPQIAEVRRRLVRTVVDFSGGLLGDAPHHDTKDGRP